MKLIKNFYNPNVLAILLILISVIVNGVYFFFFKQNDVNSFKALVSDTSPITEDGGFYFQNIVVEDSGKQIRVRANLGDRNSDILQIGDNIVISQIQKNDGTTIYQYSGIARSEPFLWIFILFIVGLFVTIGFYGVKYVFPFLFLLPFFLSSLFLFFLTKVDQYLFSTIFLGTIAYLTSYIRLNDRRLALSITLSVVFTLFFVFIVNFLLQKIARLEDLYYAKQLASSVLLSRREYSKILSTAILFIAFGAVINSSMEVSTSIKKRKSVYDLKELFLAVRKGINIAQKTTGREINNLFFVLFGASLVSFFALATNQHLSTIWDTEVIVEFVLNFVSASLAVILIAPVSSIVSSILIYKTSVDGKSRL